jgi:hypothetical protein
LLAKFNRITTSKLFVQPSFMRVDEKEQVVLQVILSKTQVIDREVEKSLGFSLRN